MYRPKELVARLGISPATLRLWSTQFQDCLSPAARKSRGDVAAAQRRYTDEDVATLLRAKALLAGGNSYVETLELLREGRPELPIASPGQPGAFTGAELPRAAVLSDAHVDGRLALLEEELLAKGKAIEALEQALSARERAIASLKDVIEAKDRTLASLKDSLQFMDVYLRTLQQERSEARDRTSEVVRQLERMEMQEDYDPEPPDGPGDSSEAKPWWKRVLALP